MRDGEKSGEEGGGLVGGSLGWTGDNYLGQIIVMALSQLSDHFVCGGGGGEGRGGEEVR